MNSESIPFDVEFIYSKALEFNDRGARDAYLDSVCQQDQRLRQRVVRLLEARDRRGDFLSSQVVGQTAIFADPTVKPGAKIGHYKLLEEIGEGGMGIVFMAEQTEPVRRRVALKVIKPGMNTRQVVARFDAERQALSLMDHPNIARVLDAGATDGGQPYFVMELVRGMAITDYCDRERLPILERLKLFVLVCQAVQHAHQKGVIHRDLKPSNVMITVVDGAAVPKIIDFGVAKATGMALTDRTLITGFHQFVGTPLYMSPEQADLSGVDVDTRSDVYGLGVLLYELLTGTTPIEEATAREAPFDELRRLVRELEPPRPSARVSTLDAKRVSTLSVNRQAASRQLSLSMREEIDWIVMKSLEKDRQRRYESAGALAADVSRYLNDEPVEACPPSRRYQMLKFARRHRGALFSTGVILAAVLIGSGISVWQAVRATRAEREKDAALQQSRRAVDDMYTKVAVTWMADNGQLSKVQRELLESARDFYANLSTSDSADPKIQYEALISLMRLGTLYVELGEHDFALNVQRSQIDKSNEMVRRHPDHAEFRVLRLNARNSLLDAYEALDLREEFAREIVQAFAEVDSQQIEEVPLGKLRYDYANGLIHIAGHLTHSRRYQEADAVYSKAVESWQTLVEASPADWNYRVGLAKAHREMGYRRMHENAADPEAESILREAETHFSRLLEERPDSAYCRRELRGTVGMLFEILIPQKHNSERLELGRRMVAMSEGIAADFPNVEWDQQFYASALVALAEEVVRTNGDATEVLDLYKRSLEIYRSLVGAGTSDVVIKEMYLRSLSKFANQLAVARDDAGVHELFRNAEESLKAFANEHSDNAMVTRQLVFCVLQHATSLIELKDHAQAARVLQAYPLTFVQSPTQWPDVSRDMATSRSEAEFLLERARGLLAFVVMLGRCSTLAENDQSLTPVEKSQSRKAYADQAKPFQIEAESVLDSCTQLIVARSPGGHGIAGWCEAMIQGKEHRRDQASQVAEQGRQITIDAEQEVFRIFVPKMSAVLRDDPSLACIAALLASAPEGWRDNDLVLEMAQRAVDLTPHMDSPYAALARQSLGWALFRSGQWQSCIDTLPNADSTENDAIVSMALWQLGRKDEALERFSGAEKRLKEIEREQFDENGQGSTPPEVMLWRLHDEASAMLGQRQKRVRSY